MAKWKKYFWGNYLAISSVQPVFEDFMKREITRLIALKRFKIDRDRVVVNKRQLEFLWKVWCGFNGLVDHNAALRNIAVRYAKICTGIEGIEPDMGMAGGDELYAAIEACKLELMDVISNATGGLGLWALPIVNALNLHILYTGENGRPLFPPIRFHPECDQDDRLIDIRRAGTTTWSVHEVATDPDSSRIDICVEADASKREALLAFLEMERPNDNVRALVPVPLNPVEEAPEEEEPEDEAALVPFLGSATPGKRRRIS